MTILVTPSGDGPLTEEEAARYQAAEDRMERPLVDPETGETPPLSPPRRPTLRGGPSWPEGPLVFVVDPALRRAYIEGSWDVKESGDAA